METVFCMSVIMSNYKENIFVIDGIDISEQSKVKLEYLLDAKNIIEKSMKQKNKYFIKQEKKELKEKSKEKADLIGNSWVEILINKKANDTTWSTATYSNNSSSSGNYYIHS